MTTPACPPKHTVYLSEYLAKNATWLHRVAHPSCPGFYFFACGDHFHVGHTSPANGRWCKAR